jgi:hypothetical protein
VKRIRGEGARFLAQLRRETQTFARQTRAEVATDVRKVRDQLKARGEQSLRDLEMRGRRMVEAFEKQVSRFADTAGERLGASHPGEVTGLAARVHRLEQRIEQLERELRDAFEQHGT